MPIEEDGSNPIDWLGDKAGRGWKWGKKKWGSLTGEGGLLGDDPGTAAGLEQRGLAGAFADTSQERFGSLGAEGDREREYLRRIARGEESVSAGQLRNSLQQNQAAQQSMAAGARPANAAMAARTAAMTAGRQGAGLAGQQAIAGIQERQAAQQGLSNAILQQRAQDLQGTLGSRNTASGQAGGGGGAERQAGALQGLASIWAMSDERIKHDVEDGSKAAEKALKGLKAHTFKYDEDRHGKGSQLGVMAQQLEHVGLGHAVIDTPDGKAVHGAKLATGLAALLPGINSRLEKLEGK